MQPPVGFREASPADFEGILRLQYQNLRTTLQGEDLSQGFLSIEFTKEQLYRIHGELGIFVALQDTRLIGYLMAESLEHAARSPLIAYMLKRLKDMAHEGAALFSSRLFVYGPVCVERQFRGRGILEGLFEVMKKRLRDNYDAGIAFVSERNPRSLQAHTGKLGMRVIDEFEFEGGRFKTLCFGMQEGVLNRKPDPGRFIRPVGDRMLFYKWASALALITILYNFIEGSVSLFFGLEDGTVALFGFGLDSYVEVVSGMGIWHMIMRMKRNNAGNQDAFEKSALRITGGAFYALAAGLVVTSAINVLKGHKPETAFWGVVVSVVSILCMWLLIRYKVRIGTRYNSPALLADANCSKACMYLSIILLVSSVGYEATGIGFIDSLGAIGIAVLSYREGREAFEKSKGAMTCGCQGKCR